MSSERDDSRPSREQIDVDALFAEQQADRRRQRTRMALITVAALAAGGVTGGIAVGAIGGEDGGAGPVAGGAGSSAAPPGSGRADPDQGDTGQEDAEDSPVPGSDQTDLPSGEATDVPSFPVPDTPGSAGDTSTGTSPSTGQQPGGAADTSSAPAPTAQPARHAVQPGESLWKITADVLGPGASAQQVLDNWPKLYEANRELIGDDPDLLYAGQELVVPALG